MSYIINKEKTKKDINHHVSDNVAPWETQSFSHLKKSVNNSKKRYVNNSTNERNQPSDEDNTLQPIVTHMKRPQVDVTRLSPTNDNLKDFYSADISCDNQVAGEVIYTDNTGGDNFGRIFSVNTRLSPSSSIMYHQHPISAYASSSKMTVMLDNECYNNSFEPAIISNMGRESMLMKQAIKSTMKYRKRRETIGEVDMTTRKRPVSTSVIPRLTKSSNLSLEKHQYNNSNIKHRPNINSAPIKQKRRHQSLQQPINQKNRNNLAFLFNEKDENTYSHHQQHDAATGVHWDPHIDAFEILRAKITGITRSMQEFHVKELFQDENRKKKRLTATTSSPLITTASSKVNNNRRFSLTNGTHFSKYDSGHRRIRSQSCIASDLLDDDNNWNNLKYLDDDDEEEKESLKVTSPNLTALFLTTNNLIHSRIDELSETASIKSTHNDTDEVTSILDWQKKFLGLVTSCIHQSEQLESLSTDVLNTEHRVRELMLINDTIHEQFNEREKQYEERIRECQEVAQQQLMMIDSLEELNADINMKIESKRRETHRQNALLSLDGNYNNYDYEEEECYVDDDNIRWNFQKSVAELLSIDDKHDMIQKMRWDIGMFVGGGVGTGHIIHSYEDNLNGIDMMIAGTGTTTTNIRQQQLYQNDDNENVQNDNCHNSYSDGLYSVTPFISHHIKLYQHQYVLHLNGKDRRTRFALLPKSLWIPDHETNQCQFQMQNSHKRCKLRFSFFQRKHHCRKCGYIMCQRHSANRLPLFSPSRRGNLLAQWSRVCDNCFHSLIMQK